MIMCTYETNVRNANKRRWTSRASVSKKSASGGEMRISKSPLESVANPANPGSVRISESDLEPSQLLPERMRSLPHPHPTPVCQIDLPPDGCNGGRLTRRERHMYLECIRVVTNTAQHFFRRSAPLPWPGADGARPDSTVRIPHSQPLACPH